MGIIIEIGKKIVNFFVKDAAERRRFIAEFNYNASSGFQTLFVDTLYEAVSCEGNPAQDYRHEMSAPVWASGFAVIAKAGREVPIDEILTIGKIILSDQKLVRKMFVLHWDTLIVKDARTGKSVSWKIKDYLEFGGLLNFTK